MNTAIFLGFLGNFTLIFKGKNTYYYCECVWYVVYMQMLWACCGACVLVRRYLCDLYVCSWMLCACCAACVEVRRWFCVICACTVVVCMLWRSEGDCVICMCGYGCCVHRDVVCMCGGQRWSGDSLLSTVDSGDLHSDHQAQMATRLPEEPSNLPQMWF